MKYLFNILKKYKKMNKNKYFLYFKLKRNFNKINNFYK